MSLTDLKEERPKSFSRYGQRLERSMHPSPIKPSTAKIVETISREKQSPFTLFHGRETQDLDYKVKYDRVRPNEPRIQISSTQVQFFTDEAASKALKEFSVDKLEQPPTTQRQQQRSRKKLHHFDFDKQPQRKLGPQPQKGMQDPELRYNNFDEQSMKRRSNSVHNFRGYTARRDLYESGNATYRSKEVSNIHEVDMNKLRKRWSSTTGFVPFEKMVNQVKVRSDRDCNPWLTKLSYSPRNTDHQTISKFELQSERKPNVVHSKYPFRICV